MYLQITSRCNMTCEHCIFSWGTDHVCLPDMPSKVFYKALELFVGTNTDTSISIRGGEPTLHTKFWEYLGASLVASDYVRVTTNGSNPRISLALLGLSSAEGSFSVDLLLDNSDSPIDPVVEDAFRVRGLISTITNSTSPVSAKQDITPTTENQSCHCGGVLIQPSGAIYPCACPTAPYLGNVLTITQKKAALIHELCVSGDCYKDYEDDEPFYPYEDNPEVEPTKREILDSLVVVPPTSIYKDK